MNAVQSQVLVVDADAEIRKLVAALLQRIGVQSILVQNGKTALTLLEEGLKPALIVLDLGLPEVDSFDVLAQMRSLEALDDVPVLVLTSAVDPSVIRRALDVGADGYVTKVYMTQSLVDRVRVLIAAGRQPQPRTWHIARTAPLIDPERGPGRAEDDSAKV